MKGICLALTSSVKLSIKELKVLGPLCWVYLRMWRGMRAGIISCNNNERIFGLLCSSRRKLFYSQTKKKRECSRLFTDLSISSYSWSFFLFYSVCVDRGIGVLWSCLKSAFKEGTNTYLRSSIFDLPPIDIDKNSSETHRIVMKKSVTWITVFGILSLNKLTLSPFVFLPSTHGHTSELGMLSCLNCFEPSCLNTQLFWFFWLSFWTCVCRTC